MITYSNNLYLGDSVKHIKSIKRKIKYGRGQLKLYLITLSNSEDQLDIFHNAMLKQRYFRKLNLRVVGLANSYEEALEVVSQILDDTLAHTGVPDMKAYLSDNFD